MLIIAPLVLLRARARVAAILAIDIVVSLLILADLVYYRYFFGLITVATLEQCGQAGAVSGSIVSLIHPTERIFSSSTCLRPFVLRAWGPLRFLKPAGDLRSRRSAELAVFAVLIGSTLVATPVEAQRRGGDAFNSWWDMATYQFTGLIGFHALRPRPLIRARTLFRPAITPAQQAESRRIFSDSRPLPCARECPSSASSRARMSSCCKSRLSSPWCWERDDGGCRSPNLDRAAHQQPRVQELLPPGQPG